MAFVRQHPRASIVLAGMLMVSAGSWLWIRSAPDAKFRAITGQDLPPGVHAAAYATEMTDNLFHRSHYWVLTGSPEALQRVIDGTGFTESLENARWAVPDMQHLFRVPLSHDDVVAGYEWEGKRDRWFCIFGDSTTALYIH